MDSGQEGNEQNGSLAGHALCAGYFPQVHSLNRLVILVVYPDFTEKQTMGA